MLKNLASYLANAKKALINITGLVGSLLALGLLPDKWAAIGATVLSVLTVITHYLVANSPAPGDGVAVEDFAPEDDDDSADVDDTPVDLDPPASQVAADNEIAAPPSLTPAVANTPAVASTQ